MPLHPHTVQTLKHCSSIHQPHGFSSLREIRNFWNQRGAIGFLNIREITPQMVREIREHCSESQRPND